MLYPDSVHTKVNVTFLVQWTMTSYNITQYLVLVNNLEILENHDENITHVQKEHHTDLKMYDCDTCDFLL